MQSGFHATACHPSRRPGWHRHRPVKCERRREARGTSAHMTGELVGSAAPAHPGWSLSQTDRSGACMHSDATQDESRVTTKLAQGRMENQWQACLDIVRPTMSRALFSLFVPAILLSFASTSSGSQPLDVEPRFATVADPSQWRDRLGTSGRSSSHVQNLPECCVHVIVTSANCDRIVCMGQIGSPEMDFAKSGQSYIVALGDSGMYRTDRLDNIVMVCDRSLATIYPCAKIAPYLAPCASRSSSSWSPRREARLSE